MILYLEINPMETDEAHFSRTGLTANPIINLHIQSRYKLVMLKVITVNL